MSCTSGIKFLINEYYYLNNNQEALVQGVTPADEVCNFLAFDQVNNHYQTMFLGSYYEDTFSIPDCVAVFGVRDMVELSGGYCSIDVLAADNIDFTVNVQQQLFTVALSDLVGIEKTDFYANLTNFTVRKPYWAVRIYTAALINRPVRKIMLGKCLTLSRNPVYPLNIIIKTESIEATRNLINFQLNYRGLTEEDKNNLLSRLISNQDYIQGALIDEDNNFLFTKKIIMFRLAENDIRIRPTGNAYDVNLNIQELL